MPKTFTQIFLHIVFSVKNRQAILKKENLPNVFRYISAIVKDKGGFPIAVNGTTDHVHILCGIPSTIQLSKYVSEIKSISSGFIKREKYASSDFSWQESYGAFSVSKSHLDALYKYISNQEEHHRKITFKEELIQLLKDSEVEFNEADLPVMNEN